MLVPLEHMRNDKVNSIVFVKHYLAEDDIFKLYVTLAHLRGINIAFSFVH